ncbi:MAG: helix-turn-helix transcriptional regulator [Thermodesulfobacteriota bacterium]|nr:helix-turn-helix transcriptional regulator [Thermodesulfobacteriota bacterium]
MNKQKLPEEYLQRFGHRLKMIRAALNYDQKQMSKALDTAQSQVSKIEAGSAGLTLYQLLKLKRVMEQHEDLREVSWSWILEGKGRGTIQG